MLKNCESILQPLVCQNCYEDIIDKGVIDQANWLMYGCSKPSNPTHPYMLTYVFDDQIVDQKKKFKNNKELIKILSIRDHDMPNQFQLKMNIKMI